MATTTALRTDLLACPRCLAELHRDGSRMVCAGCSEGYPVIDGIPCFAPTDGFYDEYATEHCPYAISPGGLKRFILRFLPFWSWREWRFWNRAVPECERLIDLGCGRGREVFATKARETVGYDISLHFIRECATHYDTVAQGPLPHCPFPSQSFDVVVASHVLGHIPSEHKDDLVGEIARLLRPGGTAALLIETDSDHPTVMAAKRKPEVYKKQFVEQHGHIGLEHADLVVRRFEENGFRLRKRLLVDAVLPSVLNFRTVFKHPEYADLPGLAWPQRLDRWTSSSPAANLAYEIGMGIFHLTVEQWFGKPNKAQFILVAFF